MFGGDLFNCEPVNLPVSLVVGVVTSKYRFRSLLLDLDFMHPLALRQKQLVVHASRFIFFPSYRLPLY